jgi:hypothetical protein
MKYYRRCIRITAEDSPNVRFAKWEIEQGRVPTNRIIVPGVISWEMYQKRRKTLNEKEQCESLDAEWYEGADIRLVPRPWLYGTETDPTRGAISYNRDRPENQVRYIGCDPGEGGDDSCWVVGGRHGIDEVVSKKTPNTNDVISTTMDLQFRWKVDWENIIFDEGSGGGGRVHIDRFWANGRKVRGVGFGATPQLELRRGMTYFQERKEQRADKYAFVHCRDEMAHDIRCLLERDTEGKYVQGDNYSKCNGFGIPDVPAAQELIRQLLLIPFSTDGEGRMKLPPKRNPVDTRDPNTLVYIIGHSPDQFDAFCLMVYGMNHNPPQQRAGVK